MNMNLGPGEYYKIYVLIQIRDDNGNERDLHEDSEEAIAVHEFLEKGGRIVARTVQAVGTIAVEAEKGAK